MSLRFTKFASVALRRSSVGLGKSVAVNAVKTVPQLSKIHSFQSIKCYSTPAKQLKEVLKQELKISNSIPNDLDTTYQEYINSTGFEVVEKDGNSNVELVKKVDGETIRVFFDIDEVTDVPVSEAGAEEADLEEEVDSLDSFLCNVKVIIEKPESNNGLLLNLFLQPSESSFMVDFVNYQNDISTLLNQQIYKNNEFIDKVKYQGPRFSDLDESVQTGFETYLESKGIDNELAEFVIAFSEYKEEKEYRGWLSDLADFVN